jgi:DNA-binding NtrC family response regulator
MKPTGSVLSHSSQSHGESRRAIDVLIVDDEPLIRWSLRRGLTQRGHQVAEAGGATEALARLAAEPNRFDVVLLDYRLPDRQDLSLLKDIRKASPSSAVLMMTAYGEPQMRHDALALGARIVIDKPFQVSAVVALVESPPSAAPSADA